MIQHVNFIIRLTLYKKNGRGVTLNPTFLNQSLKLVLTSLTPPFLTGLVSLPGEQGRFFQANRRLHRGPVRVIPSRGIKDQAEFKQVKEINSATALKGPDIKVPAVILGSPLNIGEAGFRFEI